MAGIGFQLKKLYNRSGFFSKMHALGYSASVAVGPMFLTILLVTFAREWLLALGTPRTEVMLFMASTQYSFTFSQIITGGFLFIISRYVADLTFLKKEEDVLSSLYGILATCLSIGFVLTILFYWNSPLPFSFKLISYLFFCELMAIWILSMYVSALKDYKKIASSYFFGVLTAGILIYIIIHLFEQTSAFAILSALTIGFLVVVIILMSNVRNYFRINTHKYFHYFYHIENYPLLFFIGLFYYVGLYGHSFVIWFSTDYQSIIKETFVLAPFYDVPIFYAYLSVLPSLILFMVTIETSFYTVYKKYYSRILNGGSLKEIQLAKSEMFRVLKNELIFLAQIQVVIVFLFIFMGIQLLPQLGLTNGQVNIYIIAVIGNWFLSLMVTVFLILLYFDAQHPTLKITAIYCFSSIACTFIAAFFFDIYGAGIFIASSLGLFFSLSYLKESLDSIDYKTFCSQPIIPIQKNSKLDQLLK